MAVISNWRTSKRRSLHFHPGALLCGTRNTRNGIRGTHGIMRRKQNGDAHGIDDCSLDRPDKRSLCGRLCRITSV